MSVSPQRRARNSKDVQRTGRSARRNQRARSLNLESLEKRELLAADVTPFQNSIFAYDVDGDFVVSPLDALAIINRLNAGEGGSLAGRDRDASRDGFYDVDGDNYLTPLDALSVINRINNGEGEDIAPKLVEVKYEFYRVNADGTVGELIPDSDLSTPEVDVAIGNGEQVIVRTTMKDLRSPLTTQTVARGVYSAYHNLNFTNQDGSSDEKLQLQWSDYYRIKFDNLVIGGSVDFKWGSESVTVTPVISAAAGAIDPVATMAVVQSSLEQLFGAGQVRVRPVEPFTPGTPMTTADYDIHFTGDLARQAVVPKLEVANNNLNVVGGNPALTFTTVPVLTPANDLVTGAALNHNVDNGSIGSIAGSAPVIRYTNGPAGSLQEADGASRTIRRLGGFANVTGLQSPDVATRYLGIVDTLFVGVGSGLVQLQGSITPIDLGQNGDNLGIALFDDSGNKDPSYLGAAQVRFIGANLTIIDTLTANDDTYTFQEDLGGITPPTVILSSPGVLDNDLSRNEDGNFVPALQVGTVITDVRPITVGAGTARIVNGTQIEFSPTPDYHGVARFEYSIRNRLGDTATGTITINLVSVNDPPRAVKTSFATTENIAAPGLVIEASEIFVPGPENEQNETPPQTVALTAVRTTPSTNGTVVLVDGRINFVPSPSFNGTSTFVVDARDNLGAAVTGVTITVTVESANDPPIVVATNFSTDEDTPLTIQPTQIFSPGPPDEASQIVTLTIETPPAAATGTATVNAQGRLVVTPAANYFGPMTIVVRGTDNGLSPANLSTLATLTITVNSVNDAPIAEDDAYTLPGIGGTTILPVTTNDRPGPGPENERITITSVSQPTLGSTRLVNGEIEYTIPTDTAAFGRTTTFTYVLTDEFGLTDTATVTISIAPPAPLYAIDDNYRTNERLRVRESADGSVTYTFDVLANDYTDGTNPLTLAATPVLVSGEGEIGRDGNLVTFKPNAGYAGEVVLTYQIEPDSAAGAGRYLATATLLVQAVNDPPVAEDRTLTTLEDTPITVDANSLGLSSGPGENDVLRFTTATLVNPAAGTVAIVDGRIVFTPAQDSNVAAVIRYIVTDDGEPNEASNEARLTINITPVNDPPIAVNDTVGPVAEDTSLTILISTLLSNDRPGPANESGQTLTFVPITGTVNTQHGTIRQTTANGQDVLIYTPNRDYNGTDTFTYQISDGQATNSTAQGTVTVTVTEVNDAPVATNLTKEAFGGVSTTFDISSQIASMSRGAANESNQTLTLVRVAMAPGSVGSVVLNANGTITYTAPVGASGTDTFTYTIRDNGTTAGQPDPKEATGNVNVAIQAFQPSSVSGVVYVDDNGNGKIDSAELRVGGADVTLTIAADPNVPNSVVQTLHAVTLADGSYRFDTLPPGSYTVSYAIPSLSIDAPGANSFTKLITAPGGMQEKADFAISGISARYANIVEYLASSYYFRDPSLAGSGLYATVSADGVSDWTAARGDFSSDTFHEVVLSADGRSAIVTAVRGSDNGVYSAVLSKSQFVKTVDEATGVTLIRVLARSSDLSWQRVNLATPSAPTASNAYLKSVDELFSSMNW